MPTWNESPSRAKPTPQPPLLRSWFSPTCVSHVVAFVKVVLRTYQFVPLEIATGRLPVRLSQAPLLHSVIVTD